MQLARKPKIGNTTPAWFAKVSKRLVDKFPVCDVSVILPLHSPFPLRSLPHACTASVHNQGEQKPFFYTVLSQYPLFMPSSSSRMPVASLYLCLTKIVVLGSKGRNLSFPNNRRDLYLDINKQKLSLGNIENVFL